MKHWHVYLGDYENPCKHYQLATPLGFPTRTAANRWAKADNSKQLATHFARPALVKQCDADCEVLENTYIMTGYTYEHRLRSGFPPKSGSK